MTDCEISSNEAYGSYAGGVWFQAGTITRCTIVANAADDEGGGVYCSNGTGSIIDCIIANSTEGEGVACDADDVPTLTCCDVYGNAGGNYDVNIGDQTGIDGNISEDPEFCDPGTGDYSLYNTSPCLPGGNGCGVQMGAYGHGCDSPVGEMSWGALKALLR
jgi:hypothetical protein